ncbi:hypothetical protein SSX86_027749 [Deinandra increscens subsp. villosa]|uniref:Transposase-associated domain-containing protein n=1 Tax=Deinandra increscens subsp. villosa TaxID=3103831 RepID=A0AAP0C9C9_9ASTR
MVVDKSWLNNPNRSSTEYSNGLDSFLEMCKGVVDERGYVFCPCNKCKNTLLHPLRTVKYHLKGWGFWATYKVWNYHGESLVPEVVAIDDVASGNNMGGALEDLMQVDTNIEEGNSDPQSSEASDDFDDLLKELQSELYPGCTKFSSLNFLAKLMHIKVYSMKKQNSPELHSELYALSMGSSINASTYTACIVNGVRFMVLDRDVRRKTQNSGVSVEGEDGHKYYGQLEEIIELRYPNGYSTVLFRCKWFDTHSGVRFENNITSINTTKEWDKEDQLIFASQARQVFYIQEPSRGNQNNNHRWVVEHVNHRRIWDLPLNVDCAENVEVDEDENVQNVDNNSSSKDLDVVNNNSSSAINLFVDFRQYFPSSSATQGEAVEVSEDMIVDVSEDEFESETEVSDSEIEVFEGSESDVEVSEGEISEGGEMSEGMICSWYLLLYVMAEVMGYGGDGAGQDPPPPGGYGAGHEHYEDGKNEGLEALVKKNGGPLTLIFDRFATFEPLDEAGKYFKWEVGKYIWHSIPFDKPSWEAVSEAEKNAMLEHLKASFDLDKINNDPNQERIRKSLRNIYMKRYRDRKYKAHLHFNENGGDDDDIERALGNLPKGMQIESWRRSVDLFMSEKYKNRSTANASNRQAQQITNRGGTLSYSNTSYKKAQTHLQTFIDAHTLPDGTIDPLVADTIRELQQEIASQSQPDGEGTSSQRVNELGAFKKVLKPRRGWIRGIGFKACSEAPVSDTQPQPPSPPSFTQDQIKSLIQNPYFQEQLSQLTGLNVGTQDKGNEGNDEEDGNNDGEGNTDDE